MPTSESRAPSRQLGNLTATGLALVGGRLQAHLHEDIRALGGSDDDARAVAASYVCLFGSGAWLFTAWVIWLANPTFQIAVGLAIYCSVTSFLAYLPIRSRRSPRAALGLAMGAYCLAILWLASLAKNPGYMIPALLPVIGSLGLLAKRGPLRVTGMLTSGVGIVLLGAALDPAGIGALPDEGALFRQVALSSVLFASLTFCSFGLVHSITRNFGLEALQETYADLVEATSRSELALEVARVSLWEIDQHNRLTVSPSFTTITGLTAEDLQDWAVGWRARVHTDDIGMLEEGIREGVAHGSRLRLDVRFKTKARGYRWFAVRARFGAGPGDTMKVSGSIQDIHFAKTAEEALRSGRDRARESARAKADFIAVMSHEVRTPLNAILGAVSVLRRRQHDPDTSELLVLADEAGKGLMSVVNDLLDVSRIEAGKMEIDPIPSDIAMLVQRTAETWMPQAQALGLALSLDIEGQNLPPVRVDAARIRQILSNLVSNALKFTDRGEVRVSMRVSRPKNNTVKLTIDVADTGRGVPDALAGALFLPFERARDHGQAGSGLGLYISRNLARLMGGDLTIVSTSPSGSCFRLELPAPLTSTVRASPPETTQQPDWRDARILCVDDNDANRRIIHHVLAHFGATPVLCASGEDALAACASQRFDIILMDILMPGLDGLQTLAALRAGDSVNNTTPVIALTARLSVDDIASYLKAGFVGVAGKPIDIAELARMLAPYIPGDAARAA